MFRIEAWEVLQQAKEDGLVCHIGVSNWNDEHLSKLLNDPRCKVVPELNQIENHPYHVGQNVIDFCNKHQILIQAYGPLGNGRSERAKGGPDGDLKRVLDDPDITDISKNHNLTVAQVKSLILHKLYFFPKFKINLLMPENFKIFVVIFRSASNGQFKKVFFL